MNRREWAWAAAGGLATTLPHAAKAVEPISRVGKTPLRLSLAAYSLRQQLPNYRAGKRQDSRFRMLDFIRYCSRVGVDGAEITAYFLPDPAPRFVLQEMKRVAHVEGIEISGGAIGNNFAHSDPQVRRQQLTELRRWLEVYAFLGAPVIRVFAGRPATDLGATTESLVVDQLGAALEIASQFGIFLALENHDITTDVQRLLRIVRAVASPWLGVNLDTGNLPRDGRPYEAMARLAPYAVNVQVKSRVPMAGEPVAADYARIVELLGDSDYRGYLVLEYEGPEPETSIPQEIARLRQAIG